MAVTPQNPDATQIIDLTEETKKRTSSVHDANSDPPFGSRFLVDPSLTFTQNAWDHVPPPTDQASTISASLARQRAAPVSEEERHKLNSKPAKYWDNFYKNNEANFFKDRKWLHNEFPDLVAAADVDAGPLKIAEIGCGAGNSIFPVLSANQNPIKLVQHNPLYISPPCGTIHSAVWDLSSHDTLPPGLSPGSVDIVILVFVLSALHPDEWASAIRNVYRILKPKTGRVLFRDYGRYDLTQLRFKNGRMLGDHFYKRGDGTRVYFFELDELSLLFAGKQLSKDEKERVDRGEGAAQVVDEEDADSYLGGGSTPSMTPNAPSPSPMVLPAMTKPSPTIEGIRDEPPNDPQTVIEPQIHPNLLDPLFPFNLALQPSPSPAGCLSDPQTEDQAQPKEELPQLHPLFATVSLGIDRRLIVNRKRQLKMYRVWMQGVFRKV
ncbi:methyltransferase [Gymnopus androsaceus JB14]|uniref:tRNA N(3)-methylcytidine methyltransferase n=1 Tax=Gymnopus androsaceus JB14 TaxID=1447944 RepID=A0A6A4H9H9_9AGAR|nr:methyltransferase [Gymnopus androsaceus JB14]